MRQTIFLIIGIRLNQCHIKMSLNYLLREVDEKKDNSSNSI